MNQEIISNKSLKILKLILVVLLIMIIPQTRGSFNPRVDAWYAVEDWEIEVCSKWGGTQESQSGATSSTAISLSQTTLSLQGKTQSYDIDGVNKSLYTASWYLEPLGDMTYKIELVNDDESISFRISDGDASYSTPTAGYHSEYYDVEYTAVKMYYGTQWLRVPLVKLE